MMLSGITGKEGSLPALNVETPLRHGPKGRAGVDAHIRHGGGTVGQSVSRDFSCEQVTLA